MFGGLNEITVDLYTNNSTFGGERKEKKTKKRRRWEAKTNAQKRGQGKFILGLICLHNEQ